MTEKSGNNLWRFLEAIARRRAMIVSLVTLAAIAATVVALLLPPWFEATAVLLPPKNVTMPTAGMTKLNEVASVIEGLNLPMMVTPTHLYARILASRAIADAIISEFDLTTVYETETAHDTYLTLMAHSRFVVEEEGSLLIAVEDKDPQRAADLANAFVAGLERLNQEIVSGRSRQNREFVEDRVAQVAATLDTARQEFEDFQLRNRAVDFDQQTRLAIEEAITLKVTLSKIEIDIKMARTRLGAANPELIEQEQRREIVIEELRRLELGGGDSSFFSLPIASVPTLRGRYDILYSRVKVHEQLYSILVEQFEQAKLSERENLPTVSVLDFARPPDIRSRPQRTLIVVSACSVALLVAMMIALLSEYFRRLSTDSPEDYKRASFVVNALFGWLPFFKTGSK